MPRPRIPERRNRILDAARDLALEKGWRATTVADIAGRVGIGKGAVYLEFADKPAILEAALLRSMRQLTGVVHDRITASVELVTLPALYGIAVEALLGDPLMRAFSLGDEGVLGDHVRTVTDDRYHLRFSWLLDYVAGLQAAGVIASDVPRETLGRVLSAFTIGLLHTPGTLGPITDTHLRETVTLFADLVGRGLATEAPIDPIAARATQAQLLDTLADQLDQLQEQT